MSGLLTKAEAAERLGVSPTTVTRLINSNKIETVSVGKREVIKTEAVDKYLSSANLIPAPSDRRRDQGEIPRPMALSFFSGAGGLDLGMERAGIEHVFFCENNREARMTLTRNWPHAALAGDIMTLDAPTVRSLARIDNADIDVMAGGPPCQAFSTAGARRAFDDPRGNVFLKFLDLFSELRPKYLVVENVRGLLSTPFPVRPGGDPVKGGALSLILEKIRGAGYEVSFNLYNAANFGAAQVRERVIIVATRNGERFPWLRPTHSDEEKWQSLGLSPWRTFKDATKCLKNTEHHFVQFPPKRLAFFELLSEGQNWTNLPKELQRSAMGKAFDLSGGRTGFYRRIRFDRPSPTLVTSPIMPATDLCHPHELRPLSVEEYKAVQGFPDDWWVAGDIKEIYRQLGNAVPVQLGEAIGRQILLDLHNEPVELPFSEFPFSRYKSTNDLTWQDPKGKRPEA